MIMQVIITLAGAGLRYKSAGFPNPKPLIQIAGRSMIEHQLKIFPSDWKIILACNAEVALIMPISKKYKVVEVKPTARGPVDTVLQVLKLNELDLSEPTIVSYCDFSLIWNVDDFLAQVNRTKADAAIVSYRGFHPTYFGPNSYCHLLVDEPTNIVVDLKEKELFGDDIFNEWTSCGLYYFKSGQFLQDCLNQQIQQQLKFSGGEYYTSLAIKAMKLVKGIKITNYEIKNFYQFGTPQDWERAEYWFNFRKDCKFNFKFIPIDRQPSPLGENYNLEKVYWEPFFDR